MSRIRQLAAFDFYNRSETDGKIVELSPPTDLTPYYNISQVDAQISSGVGGVIDGAPATLDTLREIALSIGNDNDLVGSVTTLLAGKVDDSQVLTNVPSGALFTDTVYTHPANHAISVVTGLQSALDGKVDDSQVLTNVPTGALFTDTETTTSLSIAANILKYTDEVGGITNLDLSLYLDDTNLAYVQAGTLNGSTGVATFTRSDATTFTVDLSALLDDTSVTVNNTLTSTSTTEALSANQGKVLKGLADSKLPLAGGAMTGDIDFGDNVKAKFGASDDLQIYHDGVNSHIRDVGTGRLVLSTEGDAVSIQKNPYEAMIIANVDGAVDLYHNNIKKLATTSTGIDVTGSVTCDGLSTIGNSYVGGGNTFTQATSGYFFAGNGSFTNGIYGVGTNNVAINANGTERLRINSTGNVGIGTSSPSAKLQVSGANLGGTIGDDTNLLTLYHSNGNASYLEFTGERTATGTNWTSAGTRIQQRIDATYQGYMQFNGDGNNYGISFGQNNTERMRIDTNGNVGIGTTSPAATLDLSSRTDAVVVPNGTTAQRPATATLGMMRYNTDSTYFETYSANGWTSIATSPTIISVSPSGYDGTAGTEFTINGSAFDTSATIKFITNAGVEYTAGSVSYINSNQITTTTPQNFSISDEPLDVKVINGSGLSYTLENVIDCGGVPNWSTPAGSIGSVYALDAVDIDCVAVDPDGQSVSYALQSGALPTNTSLSSGGNLSGTAPNVSSITTNNFTLRASDTTSNSTDRSFSVTTNPVPAFAVFGTGFSGQSPVVGGTAVTIDGGENQSSNGQTGWSTWNNNVNSDSNLYNYPGSNSINDSDSICTLHLSQPTRVYLLRNNGWNSVPTSGWTSYTATQFINAASSPQNYYKDFAAGTHYLDNNSSMYVASGCQTPTTWGQQDLYRMKGSYGSWFSPGHYGVDTGYSITHGAHIKVCDWVTGSSASGARIWMFVMEKSSSNNAVFYLRAGWMFIDNNPGGGFKRTMSCVDAASSIGNLGADKSYVVPSSGHLQSGEYYIGWYSGDPYGGTSPNGNIYVDQNTESAQNGTIHYTTIDTLPTDGTSITFTNLNRGMDIMMAMYGW